MTTTTRLQVRGQRRDGGDGDLYAVRPGHEDGWMTLDEALAASPEQTDELIAAWVEEAHRAAQDGIDIPELRDALIGVPPALLDDALERAGLKLPDLYPPHQAE